MRGLILAGAWLLAATNIALAEATQDGARELVETYHKFLGEPAPGRPEYVRVEAQGDSYRVTFDLAATVAPLSSFGIRIEPGDLSFTVEPQPDGSSRYRDFWITNPLTYRLGDVKVTYDVGGAASEGVKSPEQWTWRGESRFEDATVTSEGPLGGYEAHYGLLTMYGEAAPNNDGSVDIETSQSMHSVKSDTRHFLPAAPDTTEVPDPEAGQWIDVVYRVQSLDWTAQVSSLDLEKLSDLWIEAVSRAKDGGVRVDNAELREWYSNLTPIYERAEQSLTVHDLRAVTPVGEIAASELGFAMSIPGLVHDGEITWTMSASELSAPDDLLPAWASDLMAKDFSFTTRISGFDLEAFADRLVADLDVERTPMLEDATVQAAALDAIAEGGIRIVIGPDSLHGPVLALENQGELRISPEGVSGSFNLTVTGLQEAIAAAQGGGSDPRAQQMLGVLAIGQMLAKPVDDGSSFFRIELLPDGSVVVNGQIVKPAEGSAEEEL